LSFRRNWDSFGSNRLPALRLSAAHSVNTFPSLGAAIWRLEAMAILLLAGCSTLDLSHPRGISTASPPSASTPLGAQAAILADRHPGQSGFSLLSSGIDAFAARIALIDSAQESLDVQYYIIHGDVSGKVLLERLLAAADRGVRVRILVDDIYTGDDDPKIAVLDSHPRMEIRLFNPWRYRGAGLGHAWNFLTESGRLNHRMHNKLLVADSAALILGGRNVGDEYFGLNEEFIFSDLDVLVLGPVAAEAEHHFDRYWNSDWAIPVTARRDLRPAPADLDRLRADLAAHLESVRETPFGRAASSTRWTRRLQDNLVELDFAPATILADDPGKVVSDRKADRGQFLMAQIRRMTPRPTRELLLCSPYFVPGREGVRHLESMTGEGVTVRVLTNAQEAGDVAAVHSGYAPYRADLLRAGVQLYELKRISDTSRQTRQSRAFGSANSSLHTKCLVADRRHVFIGSLNLDPRSIQRNTETGIVIESPELGEKLAALFERGTSPEFSYQVVLRDGVDGNSSALEWIATEKGQEERFDADPGTTWFQRFKIKLLRLLPIESQL